MGRAPCRKNPTHNPGRRMNRLQGRDGDLEVGKSLRHAAHPLSVPKTWPALTKNHFEVGLSGP